MATSNLQIQIKAFVEGLAQIQQLGAGLTQAGKSATDAGKSAATAGGEFGAAGKGAGDASSQLAQFVGQGQQAADSFNKLVSVAKAAAVAFVAFAAVASLKDAANIAARNETLGVTLAVVGQNAGYGKDELAKYEKELEGLGITTGAARESMIAMMQAGLQIGPVAEGAASRVAELARAAQDLAVVQGTSSSETLTGLIRNIQQLDTEGLRMQGIVVDLDAAYTQFAQSVGKSATALSTQEKQQALNNAVMVKAGGLAGAYEASLETVGKKLSSMARLQEGAAASIGESLLPAYRVLVDAASAFLVKVQQVAKAIAENGKVAQVLKDILQSVLDFASAVTSTLVDTVQSIAPHIEEAFSKLQEAFSDVDMGGLISVFKEVVLWATELATAIVDAVGNAAPSIRLLYDAFTMVADSIIEAVREVMGFAESTMDSVTAGEILSKVLQGLGLLVAGFADGLSIVKAVAEIMFAGVMVGFGAIANVIGDVVGLVNEDLGQAFKQAGDSAIEMGMKSAEAASKTFKSFADGETYVQKYADKLKELPEAHRKEAEAAAKGNDIKKAAYAEAEKMVREYTRAVLDGKLKGEDAANAWKKTVDAVNAMGKEFNFSEKELAKLKKQLDDSRKTGVELDKAFKDLKVNASEFGSGMSQAGGTAVNAFKEVVKSAQYTSAQLYSLFKDALNMETSIAGLGRYKTALDETFKTGKISAEQYGAAVQLVGGKFDELFQKSLKAASTKEDFRQLEDQVRKLGTSGAISGQQMATALDQIRERASGAREELQRLAQQATQLAEANTRIAQASLAVTRAAIEVQQAKNALLQAENRHKEEGTALSRAELEVARLNVQLAEQKARLAQLQKQQEIAAMDVLIAKQQVLNAEKEAELKIGDAAAAAKVEAAKKELESKNLVLERSNQAVESQQQNVLRTEEAAAQAGQLAENLRQAADEAKRTAENGSKVRDWVRDASGAIMQVAAMSMENVVTQFQDMGLSLKDATNRATELMGGMKLVVGYGWEGVQAYQKIADGLKETKAQMDANAEAASKVEENYRKVADSAEDIAAGVQENGRNMIGWGAGADLVAEAYRRIRKDAREAGEAAIDASRSFVNSAMSIREELLNAQGREDEALKMRYEQRQKELDLEYKILEIKIQASIIQGKAAGINTSALEKSLAEAKTAFGQAKKDLAELERLELEKIKKTKEADAKAAAEKKQKAAEDAKADADAKKKAAEKDAESDKAALTSKSTAEAVAKAVGGTSSGLQSIADSASKNTGGAVKTTVVKMELGGKTVSATVAADDESKFLDMLGQARKVS